MATVSVNNINKAAPKFLIRLSRAVNMIAVPVSVTLVKGLYSGPEAQLNKVLLIITVAIPAVLEMAKFLTADTDQPDQAS